MLLMRFYTVQTCTVRKENREPVLERTHQRAVTDELFGRYYVRSLLVESSNVPT